MKSRREFVALAGLTAVATAAIACGEGSDASEASVQTLPTFEDVSIRVYSQIPTSIPIVGAQLEKLSSAVASLTDGRVTIQQASSAEQADCVLGPAHNMVGALGPVAHVLEGLPNGLSIDEHTAWLHSTSTQSLLQTIGKRAGVAIIPATAYGLQCGWTNSAINSVEDLKELKLRAAGITGKALARLGADVVDLPPNEIGAALAAGTINAFEFLFPAVDMPMFPVTKSMNLIVGWNERVSQTLLLITSPELQNNTLVLDMLRSVCRGLHLQQSANAYAANATALAKVKNSIVLGGGIQQAINNAVTQELAALVDTDSDFAKVYLEYMRWVDMVRPWTVASEQSYLRSRG